MSHMPQSTCGNDSVCRIGVISDTHGLLREEVKNVLETCQAIIHAGDVTCPEILDELSRMARIYVARGNGDREWASRISSTQKMELFGLRFFVIHNKKMIREDLSDRDIVIYGHSHIYREEWKNNQLWLNPGSCGPGRFSLPATMAVITGKKDGSFSVEKIELGGKGRRPSPAEGLPAGREKEIIKAVLKEMEKGKTVAAIAAKHQISRTVMEQICRIIVTHPGVDEDGILNRLQIVRGER